MNSDISRTFHSHPKLASWEPHSGLPENFYFRVFPNRLSRGPSTTGCLVGTTDSNSEDENSERSDTGLSTTKRLWGLRTASGLHNADGQETGRGLGDSREDTP